MASARKISVEQLRRKQTPLQRELLHEIVAAFLSSGKGPVAVTLHLQQIRKKRSKEMVLAELNGLGGSVVFEVEDYQPSNRYAPSFLGLLLSEEGVRYEKLLSRYLDYALERAMDETKHGSPITSVDVEQSLELSRADSVLLFRLISHGSLFGQSSSFSGDGSSWQVGMLREVDDLPAYKSKVDYVHEVALRGYDPKRPVMLNESRAYGTGLPVPVFQAVRAVDAFAHAVGHRSALPMSRQVHRVHFEDYSGAQFERLVFAYITREGWISAAWLGETGGDGGRDIWCTAPNRKSMAVICANYKTLTLRKAASDLRKLAKLAKRPHLVRLVAGGAVSATLREKIAAEAKRLDLPSCEVWSGTELEERIRDGHESLLARFCHGETFPDTPEELAALLDDPLMALGNDDEAEARPELSDEAKKLLHAMAAAEQGDLLRSRTMDGYGLTVGNREFLGDTTARRIIARWERAIRELFDAELIQHESDEDNFVVTNAGYDAGARGFGQ